LLKRHWIDARQGNHVTCALNFNAHQFSLLELRRLLKHVQAKWNHLAVR
jgi:hypothetical protein